MPGCSTSCGRESNRHQAYPAAFSPTQPEKTTPVLNNSYPNLTPSKALAGSDSPVPSVPSVPSVPGVHSVPTVVSLLSCPWPSGPEGERLIKDGGGPISPPQREYDMLTSIEEV